MRLIDADAIPEASWDQKEEAAFRATINKMPTIEAEPVRRGRWIPHPREREWDVCSLCKTGTKRREFGLTDEGREWVTEESYKYCPWCGAKMEDYDEDAQS